jgi:hypothetical protein
MTLGVALVCYGAVPTVRILRWRAHAFPARGWVVDSVPKPIGRGRTRWFPLVEFEASGVTVMSFIQAAANRRGWSLNHSVDVLYDPEDPHQARLASGGMHISGWLILGVAIVGVFLAVVT